MKKIYKITDKVQEIINPKNIIPKIRKKLEKFDFVEIVDEAILAYNFNPDAPLKTPITAYTTNQEAVKKYLEKFNQQEPTKTEEKVVRCKKCHRILTDPTSIARGYGPVCYQKR